MIHNLEVLGLEYLKIVYKKTLTFLQGFGMGVFV
tara:strand:- start:494 stop:595 length:102 start_codon:yes stop_codon:yes gene_type:complete